MFFHVEHFILLLKGHIEGYFRRVFPSQALKQYSATPIDLFVLPSRITELTE